MEKNELNISRDAYWNCTVKSIETTLSLLTTFEGQNHDLIDKATLNLREIIEKGKKTISKEEATKPKMNVSISPPNTQRWSSNTYEYELEKHWIQKEPGVIQIPLQNGKTATCITVTTSDGLDKAIQDIYQAPYIAIDCEMLGVKNNLPELKLLQIGVSDMKGYAIQVDIIGFDILNNKLKPILEDSNINIVGWSYRPDGMAIDSFFKQIQQAPVMDLQAKLKPIAVCELNLMDAVEKFAGDWEGINEFRIAKRYGDHFTFSDTNCIWLKSPLPPKALVYGVFDVLSVYALYHSTKHYPDAEKFYWPFTITTSTNPKAIDNWHKLRSMAVNSTPSTPSSQSSPNKHKSKRFSYRTELPVRLSPEPETNDGYDDNNTRHQLELQQAIALSLKEQYKGDDKPKEDRVVGDLDDDRITNIYYKEEEKKPEIIQNTWGEVNLDSRPFLGEDLKSPKQYNNTISSPKFRQQDASPRPPRNNNYNNNFNNNNNNSNSNNNNKRYSRSSFNSPGKSPQKQVQKEQFKSKPSKEKYVNQLETGFYNSHQTGSFTWNEPQEATAASWKSFANEADEKWKKGVDTEIEEMVEAEKRKIRAPTKKESIEKDNWSIQEDKPNTMVIPMNQLPIRKKFNGPRVLNPDDDFDDDEDDDDENDDIEIDDEQEEVQKNTNQEERKQDVPFGIKLKPGMKINRSSKTEKKSFCIEDLPIFVDDVYLYGQNEPAQLSMLKMTEFEHLNMIRIPDVPFTVTIGFHLMDYKGQPTLKALQLYLSTGESYTCVIDQACLLKNRDKFKATMFGRLLTDPKIKRICWLPEFIDEEVKRKLGFSFGQCIDLARKINYDAEDTGMSFIVAVDSYLNGWQDRDQFYESKEDYDSSQVSRKFSGSIWDRDKLPEMVLRYSALQGLAAYSLYQYSLTTEARDEDYLWPE